MEPFYCVICDKEVIKAIHTSSEGDTCKDCYDQVMADKEAL